MNLYLTSLLLLGIALVQSTIIPYLAIGQIRPDLMLLTVVSWSLLRGNEEGIVWGFIGGLSLDLLSGAPFGLATFSLLVTSFLCGLGEANVFRTHVILPPVTAFAATLIYNALFLLLLGAFGYPVAWAASFRKVVVPTALFNTLLMPVVYAAMGWLHQKTKRPEIGF